MFNQSELKLIKEGLINRITFYKTLFEEYQTLEIRQAIEDCRVLIDKIDKLLGA